jgi:hypothetical protein
MIRQRWGDVLVLPANASTKRSPTKSFDTKPLPSFHGHGISIFRRLNPLPFFAIVDPEINWENFFVSQATLSGQL